MARQRIRLNARVRTTEYFSLRFYWLHELRQLRARKRVTGANVKKEMKAAQRELVKVRSNY